MRVNGGGTYYTCRANSRNLLDGDCFANGTLYFPSGNWRNIVLEEGKIASIEMDPTMFRGTLQLAPDSVSWTGVGVSGTYDVSISRLPGDFTSDLPAPCIARGSGTAELYVENYEHHTSDASCWLDPGQTYYLNIRLQAGTCTFGDGSTPTTECSHTLTGYGDAGW